jgi:hypothetical protein
MQTLLLQKTLILCGKFIQKSHGPKAYHPWIPIAVATLALARDQDKGVASVRAYK